MWPVRHPFWEYLFDLLMFWRAPPGTLRARLYDWSYGEPLEQMLRRRRRFPIRWLWTHGPRKGHIRWVLRWWWADQRQGGIWR